ncbi:O-antigen ligase family protein [Bacillus kexueae]|uniref:O-antigen ligase family protein n=1 Tax=Aeribacillus kexueae TaxID=2078952 RepID=UPI001FAF9015|nr:O-antigen ligase family protein [Bacillus kexueae]
MINYIREKNVNIFYILILIFFALIPYSVSTMYQKILPVPTSVMISMIVSGSAVLFILFNKTAVKNMEFHHKVLLFFFYFPVLSATFSSFYNLSLLSSVEYVEYFKGSLTSRVVNYSIFFFIVYFIIQIRNTLTDNQIGAIIKTYVWSLLIMVIVGIWQLSYFLFDVPMFNLNTRSYVHSVSDDVLFNFRLTSFADEPSYLVPFMLDLIILGSLVFASLKRYLLFVFVPALTVLLFSFSVSGYANLALILFVFIALILLSNFKYKRKLLLGLLVIMGIGMTVVLIKSDVFIKFAQPVIGRLDTIFDIEHHSRMYMYVMPFVWIFDHSIISAVFGYGPGSYEFLSLTKILPNTAPVSTTSNNMFVDLIFEHGIFGFLFLLIFITYYLFFLFKRRNINRYFFIANILFIHLVITSLYRGDFVTPRFWGLMIILVLLVEMGNRLKEH